MFIIESASQRTNVGRSRIGQSSGTLVDSDHSSVSFRVLVMLERSHEDDVKRKRVLQESFFERLSWFLLLALI